LYCTHLATGTRRRSVTVRAGFDPIAWRAEKVEMPPEDSTAKLVGLREADAVELLEVVRTRLDRLPLHELRELFANPFLGEPAVREILERSDYLDNQEIRKALAGHRHTPLPEALSLVPTLYWTDLVDLGRDARTRPQVRRAAQQALFERYEGLAVGERVSIARRAGIEMLSRVRHDQEPRVIQAMLENPRLTEGVLMPLLASGAARPEVLRRIAASDKWCARYEVRRVLCRHRRAPTEVVLSLLPTLKKGDLRAIESQSGVNPRVRQRAGLLLGKRHRD